MNVAWHNTDFTFARRDDSRAIGTDEAGLGVVGIEPTMNLSHIANRNTFGNADDEWDVCFDSFKDRIRRKGRRHVNDGSIGPMFIDGFGHGVANGNFTFPHLVTFTRRHACDDLSAVFDALLRVEGSGLTGDPLNDETCVFVD